MKSALISLVTGLLMTATAAAQQFPIVPERPLQCDPSSTGVPPALTESASFTESARDAVCRASDVISKVKIEASSCTRPARINDLAYARELMLGGLLLSNDAFQAGEIDSRTFNRTRRLLVKSEHRMNRAIDALLEPRTTHRRYYTVFTTVEKPLIEACWRVLR